MIKKIRIIGFMVCGPHEADRYLEKSLEELKRLCDDVVIVGNNTDPKTEELIKSYGYWFYRDDREWGKCQPQIKAGLLEKVGRLNPDWIIAIDSDEVFAPEFTRAEAERLASGTEVAYYFNVINLYNDEEHYAHSIGIQRFWNIRFYKYMPERGMSFLNKALHCGLAPPFFYNYGWHAPYYLLHYGLMKAEDRAKKVERYKKYDPKAIHKDRVYYDDLAKELEMRPLNKAKILLQLAESKECQPRNTPPLTKHTGETMKYIYIKRIKDGVVIDIPETDFETTMKTGKFEKVSEYVPEPFVAPVFAESATCPLCGWEGNTVATLKAHKTKMHL